MSELNLALPHAMGRASVTSVRRLRVARRQMALQGRRSDMCGIAGCYQQADGQKLTDIMTDRIARHGPYASGVWSHHDDRVSVQLGHRRLSIIDLSAVADQPLSKGGLADREDNAKQIWQLLTMELWYCNARSMDVAA